MRKLLIIFLFCTITCCSQEINNDHWPSDKKEIQFSGVTVPVSLTIQQQKNMGVLCRVWGFLKYFHPRVVTGSINVDKALFSIMPAVLEAPDNESLDLVLFKWIAELGDINTGTTRTKVPDIFIEPGMQWLNKDSLIAGKLRPQLLHIFNNRHTGEKYYVKYAAVRNPDFTNEFKYQNIKGEDGGMRMLSLFRYWNTIEYFFPSKYLTADNWDNVLEKFIPQFAKANNDSSYRTTCWRLVATIHDTHGMGISSDLGSIKYQGKYFLPMNVTSVDGKMIILFHRYDSLKASSVLKPGDRIIAINDVDVKNLLDSVKPLVSASNVSALDYYAMTRICRSYQPENKLTIERDGNKMEVPVTYFSNPPWGTTVRWGYTSIYPMYQKWGDDIGYINLGKIKAASLPEIFKEFENTKGLVIDIRNYPSEFMPFALGKYLKPEPSTFVRFTYADLELPGRFTIGEPFANGEKNSDYYKGKIVILVNETSISQSEYTAMALRTAPNAIVMGSQTAGADGNVSNVFLPGGMATYISGLGVYYPDKKATQGIGIIPDIEVKPTIKGIAEGKDEVLEKDIQYIRNK
jgi:hypothetical protein